MDFTGERLIPDERRADDLYHEHIVRYMFAAQLAAGRRVLDVGCGTGYGAVLLADAGARSVLGVDVAPEAISYARQHYERPNLSFAVKDITALDLDAASFDLVVALEVIEHLAEPALLVQAAARLLSDTGVFVVSTPNPATYPPGNPFHKHEMTLSELRSVLGAELPAIAVYAQDYATALAVRPADGGCERWFFVPAAQRMAGEPDYYLAVCAHGAEILAQAVQSVSSLMYELPADRLGERVQEVVTLNRLLGERDRQVADKDAHIIALQDEMKRQGAWARELEQCLLSLQKTWYVRLFGRRWR